MTDEPLITGTPEPAETDVPTPPTAEPSASDDALEADATHTPAVPRGYLTPRKAFTMLAVGLVAVLVLLVGLLIFLLLKPGGLVIRGGDTRAGIVPVLTIVGPGKGPNPTFKDPMGAAFGLDGRIYVSDSGNNRVCVFDRDGAFLFQFGGFGVRKPLPGGAYSWQPGRLDFPVGITVDKTDGSVYVADFRNDQVQKYDAGGHYLASFPDDTKPTGRGSSGQEGKGIAVTDVAVSEGRVYATDTYQVFEFGLDGKVVKQFGKPGLGPEDLDHPNGITVSSDGTIYVSDSNHARIIAFNQEGRRLWAVGELPAGTTDATSAADLSLGMPRGLAVMDDGSVIAADSFMFDLVRITSDGKIAARFGERGQDPGQFDFPNDVDVSGDLLLCADKDNNRVQVVRLTGR